MADDDNEIVKFRDAEGYKDGETHLVSFIQEELYRISKETEELKDALNKSAHDDAPNYAWSSSRYSPQIDQNEEKIRLLTDIANEKGSVLVKHVEDYISTLREEFETKMGKYEEIIQQFKENPLGS